MTLEVVRTSQALHDVRSKARLEQLGPAYSIEVEQNDTGIQSRIAVLHVLLAVFAVDVRLGLAGDSSRIVRFAEVRVGIERTELVEDVIIDRR